MSTRIHVVAEQCRRMVVESDATRSNEVEDNPAGTRKHTRLLSIVAWAC